jgi:osmotically-inducible protein OsmY
MQKQSRPEATFGIGAPKSSHELTEARQESQILTAYALNPYLRAHEFNVTVCRGNATLSGSVAEEFSKELAVQIALGVGGIKQVDNQIEVLADYKAPEKSAIRSFGEMVDDATATLLVKSKLAWSRHVGGIVAKVETTGGKVTLVGTARSIEAREAAGTLASNTPGVRAVDNQIVVDAGAQGSPDEETSDIADSWITAKVKATFMYSSGLSGLDISVSTHRGVVTLTGKMHNEPERALAIELGRGVRGVKSVDSNLLTT